MPGFFLQCCKTRANFLIRNNVLAHLAMLTIAICFGGAFVSIKVVLREVPPITLALLRFLIATMILLTILKILEPSSKLQKADFPKIVLGGFLGITLFYFLENIGIKLTTATNASLLASTTPIFAIALDVIIFRTKISVIQMIGIVCSTIGAYMAITANAQLDFSSATFKGNLLVVGAMLSWALYILLNKSLQDKYSALFLSTYQMLFGTLILALMSFCEYDQWRMFSLNAFGNILFLAVFPSAICYFLYSYALKRLDVTITTLYSNLVPVVGVLGGWCILNEIILPIQVFGGVIIILGITIASWKKMEANKKGACEKKSVS